MTGQSCKQCTHWGKNERGEKVPALLRSVNSCEKRLHKKCLKASVQGREKWTIETFTCNQFTSSNLVYQDKNQLSMF